MITRIKRHKIKIIVITAVFFLLLCLWSFFVWEKELLSTINFCAKYLQDKVHVLDAVPLWVFGVATFILPIFFFPNSLILLIAGTRPEPKMLVLLICFLGIVANVIVSYFIARRFSKFIRSRLSKMDVNIPKISSDNQYEVTFIIRLLPSNPLAVQNYSLGLLEIDFNKYLVVSLPLQFIHMCGYVLFANGILDGNLSKISIGISLIVILGILTHLIQKKLKRKK